MLAKADPGMQQGKDMPGVNGGSPMWSQLLNREPFEFPAQNFQEDEPEFSF